MVAISNAYSGISMGKWIMSFQERYTNRTMF